MLAYETQVHIGPDGILRIEFPVAESEADCDVVVLLSKRQQVEDGRNAFGSCAGLDIEEPPDLPLPPQSQRGSCAIIM